MTENGKGLVDVGRLVLQFARINRVTFHEDGVRPESDTDHTVMVSVCACALAQKLYPNLDIGLVSQFATVHDLVEAYCDDVDSFGLSEDARKEKEKNEHDAFLRIKAEFSDTFQCMTKITHILNGGVYFKNKGLTSEQMWNDYQTMVRTAEVKYGKEFPEIIALIDELIEEAHAHTYGK
jgi:5'-deoxynucleotidase YfbR-like HD superfamily hydrolase